MKYRFTSRESVTQRGWRWHFEVITAIPSTIPQPGGQGTCASFGTFKCGKCVLLSELWGLSTVLQPRWSPGLRSQSTPGHPSPTARSRALCHGKCGMGKPHSGQNLPRMFCFPSTKSWNVLSWKDPQGSSRAAPGLAPVSYSEPIHFDVP